MKTQDATASVLTYDLSRYLPLRIVLLQDENGGLEALCEDSFGMSHSSSNVRVWWSGKAYSMLGEHNLSGIDDAEYNASSKHLVFDPLDDACPVEVNWEKWLSATDKYGKRNAPFKLKEAK